MNVDPNIWGSKYWFVLHTISLTYPDNPTDTAKRKYYDFIQNLPLFLPHADIGKQFASILDRYPVKPYLDSKVMFVKWMHFVHNEINKITGREDMSYSHFIEMMRKKLNMSPERKSVSLFYKTNLKYTALIIFFVFIILYNSYYRPLYI